MATSNQPSPKRSLGGPGAVDAHLAAMPEPQRTTLTAVRATLRAVLPHAEEKMSYAMPCFAVEGIAVAGYEAFKQHCSYFPHSGSVLGSVTGIPDGYVTTPGTLQFPVDRPLSAALVKRLVKARLDNISDVSDGKRYEFFADGRVKAVGPMKGGLLHGKWKWFRQDGTLMRTGQFVGGEPTGVWETWDRDGNRVSSTRR
jgi:uncharacterized protein YdhG (YjbR/CyaY superfamily)